MSAKPAIFLDRDGTLNVDHGYVSQIDNFHFIEGVITACKKLKEMGYLLVIVTNQSGIARGLFTEEQFHQLTEWMDWSLADRGVELDGIYYCPHHLEGSVLEYKIKCDCRKPAAGMLISAQKHLNIDLEHSFMVGDKMSDLLAGKAGNVGQLVLVRSGQLIDKETENLADIVIDSLVELPDIIKNSRTIANA